MEPLEIKYFGCECGSPEHQIVFTLDPDDGMLYTTIYLWKRVWWERVWIGIKYIFGYTSKTGSFDSSIIFEEEDLKLLADLASRAYKKRQENKRT